MDHLRSHTPTRFHAEATDSGTGEHGDPLELTFEVGLTGQPPTKYHLSKGGVKRQKEGHFHVDLVLKQPGHYVYRWRAMGKKVTASEDTHFILDRTQFVG